MSQVFEDVLPPDPGEDDAPWLAEAAREFHAEHDGVGCCEECSAPPPPPPGASAVELERWRARALLTQVQGAHRQAAGAHARLAVALADWVALYARADDAGVALDRSPDTAGAAVEVAEEVGAVLHLTDRAAGDLVGRAVRLAGLPCALAALSVGDLDAARAALVADAAVLLSPQDAAEVDRRLFGPEASGLGKTTGELRAEVTRVIAAVDAAAVVRRSRAAVAARRVRVRDLPDGMAELVATGPATAVHALREGIGALGLASRDGARSGRGTSDPFAVPGVDDDTDRRGLDAHRFDALCVAVAAAAAAPGLPPPGSAGTTLLVSLPALLALDDTPAELSGHGPVPAWFARLAARDSRLRRLLTDPLTGQVVAVDGHTYPPGFLDDPGRGGPPHDEPPPDGRRPGGSPPSAPSGSGSAADGAAPCTPLTFETCPVQALGGGPYRAPSAVARFVRLRWDRCSAAGCRRAAARCDLDHVVPHPDGPTCPCDLAPLCRRHHLMKHATPSADDRAPRGAWAGRAGTRRRRWQVHRCQAGHQHWRSPLGVEHVVAPPRAPGSGSGQTPAWARPATPPPPLTYPLEPRPRSRASAVPSSRRAVRGFDGLDPERPPF